MDDADAAIDLTLLWLTTMHFPRLWITFTYLAINDRLDGPEEGVVASYNFPSPRGLGRRQPTHFKRLETECV